MKVSDRNLEEEISKYIDVFAIPGGVSISVARLIVFLKKSFIRIEEIKGEVEKMKTDERKIAIFGEWQAETYDEKMLANAVLSCVLKLLKK